jgi:2-polyprenyl-3-methyl-5-hydroxy-6-metoxy-1,4-benzoquinol methylase
LDKIGTYEHRSLRYSSTIHELARGFLCCHTIVDIGTGTGKMADIIGQNPNLFVVGLELHKARLRASVKRRRRYFHPIIADAEHLPFRTAFFDIALFISFIEHVNHPQKCIDENSTRGSNSSYDFTNSNLNMRSDLLTTSQCPRARYLRPSNIN